MVTTCPMAFGALMTICSVTPTIPFGTAMKPLDAADAGEATPKAAPVRPRASAPDSRIRPARERVVTRDMKPPWWVVRA